MSHRNYKLDAPIWACALLILCDGYSSTLSAGEYLCTPSFFIAMIKVLLVDDNPIMKKAISQTLGDVEGITVVGECTDGDEVLGFLSQQVVDVILMDISMKRMDGIEVTRLVKENYPRVKVIGFSTHGNDTFQRIMCEAGASAYLEKTSSLEDILRTIEAVAAG